MAKNEKTETRTRRRFLQASAAATVAAPMIVPASALGRDNKPAPSERISLGIIGTNGMGQGNLRNCARYDDVEVTAVCDVWKRRMNSVVAQHKATAK